MIHEETIDKELKISNRVVEIYSRNKQSSRIVIYKDPSTRKWYTKAGLYQPRVEILRRITKGLNAIGYGYIGVFTVTFYHKDGTKRTYSYDSTYSKYDHVKVTIK